MKRQLIVCFAFRQGHLSEMQLDASSFWCLKDARPSWSNPETPLHPFAGKTKDSKHSLLINLFLFSCSLFASLAEWENTAGVYYFLVVACSTCHKDDGQRMEHKLNITAIIQTHCAFSGVPHPSPSPLICITNQVRNSSTKMLLFGF